MIQVLVTPTLFHCHLGEGAHDQDVVVIEIQYHEGTQLNGDTAGAVDTAIV